MVYSITTLSLVGFGFLVKLALNRLNDFDYIIYMGSVLAIALISVFNFIKVPLKHTVYETSQILKHKELSAQYEGCKEKESINCAAIIKDVVEFNSDLRVYKHYNEIFDLYYSDEVASLPLIGNEK